MGFFDELISGVKAYESLKDELISTVVGSSGELRSTVNEIASELTGKTPATPAPKVSPTDIKPKQ